MIHCQVVTSQNPVLAAVCKLNASTIRHCRHILLLDTNSFSVSRVSGNRYTMFMKSNLMDKALNWC